MEATAAAKDAAAAAAQEEAAVVAISAAASEEKAAVVSTSTAAAKEEAAAASNAEEAAAVASVVATSAAATASEEEAAVVATSTAAAKEEAAVVATSTAASKEEAAVVSTSTAAVKEEAAAASNAEEAAAASNAEEAAAVAAAVGEAVAAALTAMQASKKRKFEAVALNAGEAAAVAATAGEAAAAAVLALQAPPIKDQDLISRLPDDALGVIVSLLPTKEGARTQAISRRWRPLWRSAPLNLVVDRELFKSAGQKFEDLISEILSVHHGPVRRFSFCLSISSGGGKIESWFSSQAMDKLEEFHLSYDRWFDIGDRFYLLPSSVYRFAPTLRVAKFGGCRFTNLVEFKCLKQLTLDRVIISEDALQSMLSACSILESLELAINFGFSRLCISSQTLKSIGFWAVWRKEGVFFQEVVIVDAPCLERLLPLDPKYGPVAIRIISALKLKILGMLSEDISEIQFGNTVFQKMIAVALPTKMHTIRVLVLGSAGPNLDVAVNFLKCFPCLETLYVIFQSFSPGMVINNVLM